MRAPLRLSCGHISWAEEKREGDYLCLSCDKEVTVVRVATVEDARELFGEGRIVSGADILNYWRSNG